MTGHGKIEQLCNGAAAGVLGVVLRPFFALVVDESITRKLGVFEWFCLALPLLGAQRKRVCRQAQKGCVVVGVLGAARLFQIFRHGCLGSVCELDTEIRRNSLAFGCIR